MQAEPGGADSATPVRSAQKYMHRLPLPASSLPYSTGSPVMSPCVRFRRRNSLPSSTSTLSRMSQEIFFALNSSFLGGKQLIFPLAHVVSGKFVQDYFHFLMSNETA
ncbi:MAG: hypothetical protein MZU95_12480 [Desulfomicrobium escambiense]|nr:hypothetical protein [Desulfomicrobium escambiense]